MLYTYAHKDDAHGCFNKNSTRNTEGVTITTLSDEEMTKIKLVDLDKFCNFYVHDFFI